MPKDPFILLSWVNTKLRDQYSSLEELCRSESADIEELTAVLSAVGFTYDPEANRFA